MGEENSAIPGKNAVLKKNAVQGKTALQAELLHNRLLKRYRHLKKWAKRTGTNAFRLYDRDIPEIPLVLDLYDDAVSGALYKRPYEKDEAEEDAWLLAMKASISKAIAIPTENIFLKERQKQRHRQESGNQYNKLGSRFFYRDVKEGNLSFRVNLSDYLDTGLFLDARKKRALIQKEALGKRVLNLFAYTCSLSVAAAKGGAVQVDSVDLSNTYLEWGKANFALNGLNENAFSFIRSDVIRYIEESAGKGFRWDIIILDPPSFSNSKKTNDTLILKRDYKNLISRCLPLLAANGTLLFSSNAKGIALSDEDFSGFTVKDMGRELLDEDFIGKRTSVCYALLK